MQEALEDWSRLLKRQELFPGLPYSPPSPTHPRHLTLSLAEGGGTKNFVLSIKSFEAEHFRLKSCSLFFMTFQSVHQPARQIWEIGLKLLRLSGWFKLTFLARESEASRF